MSSSSENGMEQEAITIIIDSSSDSNDDSNEDTAVATVVEMQSSSSTFSSAKKKQTSKKHKKTPSKKAEKKSSDEKPSAKKKKKKSKTTPTPSLKEKSEDGATVKAQQSIEKYATILPASPLPSTSSNTTNTTNSNATSDSNEVPVATPVSSTAKKTPTKSSLTKKRTPLSASPLFSTTGKMTYLHMAHEALQSLKGASSLAAITKFMMAKHEYLQKVPPNKFKSSLSAAIKTGVKNGRFIKVKNSYKVSTEWVKKERQALRAKEAEKKARERKRQKELEKARKLKKKKEEDEKKQKAKLIQIELEKKRKEKEKEEEEKRKKLLAMSKEQRLAMEKEKAAKKEAERRKAEAEAKAKALAERIRKRIFPMDDLALIKEDKELGVKPPDIVTETPTLPYAMLSVVPFGQRTDAKPPSWAVSASSTLGTPTGSRGLFPDLLQVYHFFCGDVGICKIVGNVVPPFTIKHLIHAVDEVRSGNAKAAKTIPPLISHLFVAALRILTAADEEDEDDKMEDLSPQDIRLRKDLSKLGSGLNSLSWSEICFYYMDLMERYYSTDASINSNVLPGNALLDKKYFLAGESEIEESPENMEETSVDDKRNPLPAGYFGYLGEYHGPLAKAYYKIARQDPWNLTAEELMSLLRALTDDIIGSRSDLAEDISDRGEKLYDLLKIKKSAESNFRKVKIAYEGPKQPQKKSEAKNQTKQNENTEGSEDHKVEGDKSDEKNSALTETGTDDVASDSKENAVVSDDKKEKPKFQPTATKKEFEAAEKARTKANEAYEKGLKKLISRSEPLGYDRNFNAVYFSLHDPSVLLVENLGTPPTITAMAASPDLTCLNPNRSWHIIETKSMFDKYLSSLDVRGIREGSLFEGLSGSGLSSARRFLFDDIKEKATLLAQKRDNEDLQRRLKNAKIACAAEEEGGRRSGRLASLAQVELLKVEEEIKFAKAIAESKVAPPDIDYRELTGLTLLSEFDSNSNLRNGGNSERNEQRTIEHMCSEHWPTDDNALTGTIGIIVSEMINLEKRCNSLAPWERTDKKRTAWTSDLRGLAKTWNNSLTVQLGLPSPEEIKQNTDQNDTSDEGPCDNLFSPPSGRKKKRKFGKSSDYVSGVHKRQKKDEDRDKMTAPQIVSMLKRPLLDLEARVFTITGHEMAVNDADEAGEDLSEEENDEPKERPDIHLQWKKKVNSLSSILTRRSAAIRDTIISAIACARKAHQHEVVVDLREALMLHHPGAAGTAKIEALKVLEKYGGYTGSDDDNSADSGDEDHTKTSDQEESSPQSVESLLCGEAMMMSGSLQGDDDADRIDWKDAVKGSRTISRLAAVAESFMKRANQELSKVETERDTLLDAIAYWESNSKKSGKTKRKKKQKEKYTSASEIWANVEATSELVMGKVDGYPWWPSRICNPKDTNTATSLESLNKVLISFVGEQHLFAVDSENDVQPFSIENCEEEDNLEEYDESTRDSFQESVTLAKQIFRQLKKSPGPKRRSNRLFVEEKKSAN